MGGSSSKSQFKEYEELYNILDEYKEDYVNYRNQRILN